MTIRPESNEERPRKKVAELQVIIVRAMYFLFVCHGFEKSTQLIPRPAGRSSLNGRLRNEKSATEACLLRYQKVDSFSKVVQEN
jgi:hypothetical protein